MPILRTEAVILKGWKFGETSKIISVFTKDYGKIRLMVKGGRGPKSPFKGLLESLSRIDIEYYDKKTRDLQLLSKADPVSIHHRIIGHVERTTLGLAAAELVDRAVVGEEASHVLFDQLTNFLDALDSGDGWLEGLLWHFESRFIDLSGFQPRWDACMTCKKSLGHAGGFFHPQSGGLLCSQCGSGRGGLVVGPETLDILFFLQSCGLDGAIKLTPTPAQKAEIRRMFDLYFRTHIEHMKSLRSLEVYYGMAG
jgi:DNA repair protein RecO (recombination protein O)